MGFYSFAWHPALASALASKAPMVAPALVIFGKVLATAATSPTARKIVVDGARKVFDQAFNNPATTSNAVESTAAGKDPYSFGRDLGAKARQFGALVTSKSDTIRSILEAGRSFVEDNQSTVASVAMREKAVMAIAHRVIAQDSFQASAGDNQALRMSIAGLNVSMGSFAASLGHLRPALEPSEFDQYKALEATLAAPLEIDSLQRITDPQLLEDAQQRAQAILQGSLPGYVGIRAGANATAAAQTQVSQAQTQPQREQMRD